MRLASFLLSLTLLLGAASSALSRPSDPEPAEEPAPRPMLRDASVASPSVSTKTAAAESLDVYGGPGTLEGKFEDAAGQPDWQGWTSVDRTDLPSFWHVSTAYAENLGGQGPGNHALWCGQDVSQAPGWVSAPGYGNGWSQSLLWSSGSLSDPDSAQVVHLDFFFNHDIEPAYDSFSVAYDSVGTWVEIYRVDGRSPGSAGSFDAPGLRFSEEALRPVAYAGGGYGGEAGDEIVLRLLFESDSAYSDEDGIWDTDGAVQVDNLLVQWRDDGQSLFSFEDFESAEPYAWEPVGQPFVGDFAKLFSQLTHPDPCASNSSVVATFIDDGTPPSNPRNDPPVSTGGSLPTFENWSPPSYGLPGGWVVNYTDGLSGGEARLRNEIWSPEIVWDLPGSEDDGPEWIGGVLEYDFQKHMPLQNGLFHLWYVRSSGDGGASWSEWRSRSFFYYSFERRWVRARRDFTGLLVDDATHMQVALSVQDFTDVFGFFSDDATPGPWFDNVRLAKYPLAGPVLSLEDGLQFQDSFAQSGLAEVGTSQGRDALDVRLDVSQTVDQSQGTVPGDSMVVRFQSYLGGAEIGQMKLHWILEENPLFESALRDNRPASAALLPDSTDAGWARWRGAEDGQIVTIPGGGPLSDRRFFDLPDEDFFYPGDRLRYFVTATDLDGRTSVLPPDTTGFDTGRGYDDRFRVRALPTYLDDRGEQRRILIIDETGREDAHGSLRELFAEISRPRDFYPRDGADTYVVRAASSGLTNGIGSAGVHGASLAQLAGYDRILYSSGNLAGPLLSDGSAVNGNDAGDDIGLLTDWHALAGDRGMAHLGTNLVSSLERSSAGAAYVANVLNVSYVDSDVLDQLGHPLSVTVAPYSWPFFRQFTLNVACPAARSMDQIQPNFLSEKGHVFQGHEFESFGASVLYVDPSAKTAIPTTEDAALTLPFDLESIVSTPEDSSPEGARMVFLTELGALLGYGRIGDAVDLPPRAGLGEVRLFPNPANPRVWIHFVMGVQDRVETQIFDVRGRRVRALQAQTLPAGPQRLGWDARDDRGQPVASGVYMVRLRTNGEERWNKVAIVK